MKAGPDIAMVAALVGDPARANMLTALMTGRALTASELALPGRHHAADRKLASGEAGGRRSDRAGKTGPPPLLSPHRPRCRRRARGTCGPCGARRPHARAHRAEGSGAAPRPDLLRPSGGRSRRADARQHEEAAADPAEQADHRTDRRRQAVHGRGAADIAPRASPIRAARCARPASTGASGAIISPARSVLP